jgi:capsular polysaccharide biosynthesis protein
MASQNQLAFRRWWWLVPIVMAIGLAGAFGSLQLVQKQYGATCRLFVAIPPNTSAGESFQAAQFGQARVAAYLDLIRGDRVADGAIKSLNLDITAKDLEKRIDAKADAESVLMNVSVTDSQPQRSADLANAVCKNFLTVAADAEGPNPLVDVRMIEEAVAPQDPVSPSVKRYLALGALTGLLVGMGLVVMLGRIRTEREALSEEAEPNDGATSQVPIPPEQRYADDVQRNAGVHRVRRFR